MAHKETPTDDAFLRARRALLLDHPFFGSLVMHLQAIADPKAQAGIWVDGQSVGFNPETMDGMELSEGAGLLAKGVMQCALGHHVRRGNRDRKLWNQASDLVTIPEVIDSRLPLPGITQATVDRTYQGQAVEAVYSLLEQQAMEEQQQQQEQGEGEAGNGEANGQGGAADDPSDQAQGNGGDDSAGTGTGSPTGEVRDLPGDGQPQASAAEKSDSAQEWKIAMQQALQNAMSRGDLPASLQRLVEKNSQPAVSWQEETRRFMNALARDDLSWGSPNRRFVAAGLYLPAVHSQRLGTVVVVNDTSGSTQWAQAKFLSEMQAILEDCSPEKILYVQQDAAIADVRELEPGEEFPADIKGLGGTDFRPVFQYLETEGIEPACMIFLTDLDGNFPQQEPAYPVLWASCSGPREVPFGDVIDITPGA